MLNVSVYVSEIYKLSVNLAEKINIPHHFDSLCGCMGSMIWSTSVYIQYAWYAEHFMITEQVCQLWLHLYKYIRSYDKTPRFQSYHDNPQLSW